MELKSGNIQEIALILLAIKDPSVVMWDYFKALIPLLKDDYHLFAAR